MRVVAILAAYNEERFIGGCLEHLESQGVEAYLIDNSSTDRTVEIAEGYRGRNLVGIETLPRVGGVHRWNVILKRKEDLAETLEADWFIHHDPDEVRLPPRPGEQTLVEAFEEVDALGYDAAHFMEFTFVPTREEPEHDHPDFMRTMKHYYPFMRNFPYRINAWKKQPKRVDLTRSGGHRVHFPEQRTYPEPFKMKHYQFLSLEQARTKYLEKKKYDVADVSRSAWRHWLVEEWMQLPSESEFSVFTSDDALSLANPRARHVMADWAVPEAERRIPGPDGRPGDQKASPVPANDQLIIAGFHRSGTSLTAQLLHRSGVFLGDDLVPENRSQPRGHYEDREILRLHEEILADNGMTWQADGSTVPVVGEEHRRRMAEIIDRREAEPRMWGFKDPRVCLFLDDWKELLPDARVLVVYRYFADSTRSLHQRAANGLLHGTGRAQYHGRFFETPDLALKMWLAYNRALIDFARANPEDVLAVSFDMMRGNFPLIEALDRYFGLALPETPTSGILDPNPSIEPRGRQLVADEGLVDETLETWEALEGLGRRTGELMGIPVGGATEPTDGAFYKPTDAYASELRNQFSGFEARFLRAGLEDARRRLRESKQALEDYVPVERVRSQHDAETDLKLILKRISGSKAAPLFRLKGEFRELERKYLE